MFGRKKNNSEVITKADELQLIIDMTATKKKYEEMLEEVKEKRKELDDALKQARLLLRDMNLKINGKE